MVLDLKSGASYAENVSVTSGANAIRAVLTAPEEPETPDYNLDPNKYTIVVDPGHDGTTLGAVYPDASGNKIYDCLLYTSRRAPRQGGRP